MVELTDGCYSEGDSDSQVARVNKVTSVSLGYPLSVFNKILLSNKPTNKQRNKGVRTKQDKTQHTHNNNNNTNNYQTYQRTNTSLEKTFHIPHPANTLQT